MAYTELDAAGLQQLAATQAAHRDHMDCEAEAWRMRHDMRWVSGEDGERLHRIDPDSTELIKDFGPRTNARRACITSTPRGRRRPATPCRRQTMHAGARSR